MSGEYRRVGLHMNSNKAQTDPVERRCSRTHEPAGRIEEPVDERQEGIILFTLRSKASSRPRCHEVFRCVTITTTTTAETTILL